MLCFVLLLKFMSNTFDVNWLDKKNEKRKNTERKRINRESPPPSAGRSCEGVELNSTQTQNSYCIKHSYMFISNITLQKVYLKWDNMMINRRAKNQKWI